MIQTLLNNIQVDFIWGQRAKVFHKGAGKRIEKSNQAIDVQKSKGEEPSFALTILDRTAKPKNNIFCK